MFSRLDASLCVVRLDASSAEAAIRALAALLLRAGKVTPTFEAAVLKRERQLPTGVPFPDIAVALPHAEPEHVLAPGIAVGTLASPVKFRQMGDPATTLAVSILVMPALTTAEQARGGLAEILGLLQQPDLRRALLAAESAHAISDLLCESPTTGSPASHARSDASDAKGS